MFYEVIPVKNGVADILTYSFDGEIPLGTIVEVPLLKARVAAVVVKKVAQPDFVCKAIAKILYSKPLPKHLVAAAKFIAEYYDTSLSSAMSMILPNGVLKKRRRAASITAKTEQTSNFGEIRLNEAQKNAILSLQKAQETTKLLFGVTGSGKTNIYLSEAARTLKQQKSVILLVPEIALTGQLVRVFSEIFDSRVTLVHSGQTEAERHLIFEKLLYSTAPEVVIGPRSALFAPLNNLGLIIVDEEHEPTYFQENSPRYSAIRVASSIAKELEISCILGSATPTVTDYYIAQKLDSAVALKKKAKDAATRPKIQIVDFKNRDNFSKNRYFSNALLDSIRTNLATGRQSLIFHNRRGSAPLTICENCGEELLCPNCFLPLTLHTDTYEMICHTCGFREKVPMNCPKCGAADLIHKGFGTKLLESELVRLFPDARIMRFDADNKKGEDMAALYNEVLQGKVDILVGTQTLAKGLDLPKLATVGVVQADAGLSLPDFSAEERVFQLLAQVIGRVGRGHIDTAEVFIQTFRPEHPVLKFAVDEDYEGFFEYILKRRRIGGFPPFTFVAKAEITMKTESNVIKKIRAAAKTLGNTPGVFVSPPMPAFHERTARGYTWQIIVRAKSRKNLLAALNQLDNSFKITIDAPSLL